MPESKRYYFNREARAHSASSAVELLGISEEATPLDIAEWSTADPTPGHDWIDPNGYDWAAVANLRYYPRTPHRLAMRAIVSAGMYFGPTKAGPWTVESTAKAAAWQERRRRGVPYIHRISCRHPMSRFCWVIVIEQGAYIHCPSFEDALGTVQRLYTR